MYQHSIYSKTIHLISDDDLDEIMDQYDTDHKGGLSFSQFMDLILDGVLLDGSLDEFRAVFTAADADADGALNAAELAAALRTITGEIVCQEDVHDIMAAADVDGDSTIDFSEFLDLFRSKLMDLHTLLEYLKMKPQLIHLISDDDLDEIMDQYDTDHKGGLSFSQFMDLILDGVLLDGSLDEFRAVFTAADADADGALNAAELAAALRTITGEIVCQEDVHDIMAAADVDGDSTIDFSEFLDLFRSKLMDLHTLLEYLKMKPQLSPQASSDGATLDDMSSQPSSGSSSITQAISSSSSSSSLLQLSSEGELNDLMRQLAPEVLLVVMFGLSGDAVCQATTQAVQVIQICN
eukprot:GHUV01012208.1.p1 GENE.GHUV01012208.1~~GHUV01012208.1.p1  ORF type:complete len:351 (+),score=138.54 GHUV01012208.1:364-1416(+)